MQIGLTTDVARAMKGLKRLNKKQVPFAAALGLTNSAKRLAKIEQRMMVRQLDRPTPFTVRGIRWQRANKADYARGVLHSRVYIMDKQAEYLRLQIEGGTRTPSGRAIAVPTSNVKLNKYGNLIGGQGRIKRLLGRKDIFQGMIGGIAGVWRDAPYCYYRGCSVGIGEQYATYCGVCHYSSGNAVNWLYDRLVHACNCNEKTK